MDKDTFLLEQVRRDEKISAAEVLSAKAMLAVAEAKHSKARLILEVSEAGYKSRQPKQAPAMFSVPQAHTAPPAVRQAPPISIVKQDESKYFSGVDDFATPYIALPVKR